MTPPDCDLRGYEYMPLMGHRLFGSNLYAEATDAEFRAAVRLWWSAWNQCPAGSLPTSDSALAMLADYGRDLKGWAKVKVQAMRGFVLCGDGRLYHPILCDAALKAYALRLKADTKRKADAERLRLWREAKRKTEQSDDGNGGDSTTETPQETPSETPPETQSETRFVGGRREGEEKKEREEPPLRPPSDAPAEPSPTRRRADQGTRLPEDWTPSPSDAAFASSLGLNPTAAADEFRDYWLALPGTKGRKLDWDRTFRNRCREVAARRRPAEREDVGTKRRRELGIPSILDFDRLDPPETSDLLVIHGTIARH